jgi:transaldolase / glucose-6-phosphate isomerase
MPGASASRLAQLHRFGQSPWLDHIDRELVARGGLKRLVDRDALGGVTTNPAIFEKAVAYGKAYDQQILELAHDGLGAAEILDRLAVDDVRAACDVLAPVYMGSGGEDGFVSIEVAPSLAYDAAATIVEAQRLFAAVDRPNVMIKIPGTAEGIPAVLEAMRQGLSINITLLFTVGHYEAAADAYLDALEYRLRRDLTIRALSSVASVFVSRVDTLVDAALDERIAAAGDDRRRLEALKGRAGVANAKVVYERFRSYLGGRDWQLIAASGAKIQRLLWASTGVKDPGYPDVMYADELIGDHTVITLPEATWKAFNEHGTPARTADRHIEDAHRVVRELGRLGIDVDRLGAQLQAQGVELFREAWDRAVAVVEARRAALLGQEVGT